MLINKSLSIDGAYPVTNIGVCQLHILPCASILCVCLGDCGLLLPLFQVDFRVLV